MHSASPIVVAMSGGVDSSTTAALLQQQGYNIIGITLQLNSHAPASPNAKTCCAGKDTLDAQKTARKLNIPHYTLDFEERFQNTVINNFFQSYRKGETPIPCLQCNQHIKFDALLNIAKELGAQALATGHYARIRHHNNNPTLLKARDHKKDQSYYLFATTKQQLAFLRFPLGDLTKEETRNLARSLNLPNADKPESQDLCFVAKHYTKLFPELASQEKGEIRGQDGTVLGEHDGIAAYTIGQRKGLKLGGLTKPLYVTAIDAQNNRISVGAHEDLSVNALRLREVNWLGDDREQGAKQEEKIQVKFRSLMNAVPARLRSRARAGDRDRGGEGCDAGCTEVLFDEKQYGVACGQACVFYKDERVLGGGIIQQTFKSHSSMSHPSQFQSQSPSPSPSRETQYQAEPQIAE